MPAIHGSRCSACTPAPIRHQGYWTRRVEVAAVGLAVLAAVLVVLS